MTTVMLSGVFWKAPSPLGLLASAGRPRQCVLVTCQHSPPRGKLQRLLVEKEQSPHCWIYFLSFRADAGRLCRTVGGSALKRLCSWQPFPCAHTASRIGKFHPLTLGLYVTVAESESALHLLQAREIARERGIEDSFPSYKEWIE